MNDKKFFLVVALVLIVSIPLIITKKSYSLPVCMAKSISTCFTPGERCDREIISEINKENNSIMIQAYQLTNLDIYKAIVEAKQRGVNIKIILDKSQYSNTKFSAAVFFQRQNIPVWIDYRPKIAHNKVIILGDSEVLTGSYNFTFSAQNRNAENLIIIKDKSTTKEYTDNFNKRLSQSDDILTYEKRKNA